MEKKKEIKTKTLTFLGVSKASFHGKIQSGNETHEMMMKRRKLGGNINCLYIKIRRESGVFSLLSNSITLNGDDGYGTKPTHTHTDTLINMQIDWIGCCF